MTSHIQQHMIYMYTEIISKSLTKVISYLYMNAFIMTTSKNIMQLSRYEQNQKKLLDKEQIIVDEVQVLNIKEKNF